MTTCSVVQCIHTFSFVNVLNPHLMYSAVKTTTKVEGTFLSCSQMQPGKTIGVDYCRLLQKLIISADEYAKAIYR